MFFCLFFKQSFASLMIEEHFFNQIKHTCFCFLIISTQRERETDRQRELAVRDTHTRTRAHQQQKHFFVSVI